MTMPGRAVWIVTRADLAGRSIWMRDTEACASFFTRNLRTAMSLSSVSP
jgi:hypothetical protein